MRAKRLSTTKHRRFFLRRQWQVSDQLVTLLARLMGQHCLLAGICRRLSSVVVCNAAGGRSGRPPGARVVGRPTLHGGPVVLRLVRATLCLLTYQSA